MRNTAFLLGVALMSSLMTVGCAGPEKKLGRGMNNTFEIVRMGELRRSVEQTAVLDSPDAGYTTGFIQGLDRSIARTGVGLFEIVTAPIPPYDPICTSYLAPKPVYPESYTPKLVDDPTFATDTYTGFSGGDVAPIVPGSRFHIFDN